MTALDRVLKREDVMNKKMKYRYPESADHPNAGQVVNAPVWSFAKGWLKVFPKEKIAERIDGFVRKYEFLIAPFMEELTEVLVENGYYNPGSEPVTKDDEETLRKRIEKEEGEE